MIEQELPEVKDDWELTLEEKERLTLLHVLMRFSEECQKHIWAGNFIVLKRCFATAEKIYRQGNDTIKIAFEHLFIPRLQLHLADRNHHMARQLLPYHLLRTYMMLYAKPLY